MLIDHYNALSDDSNSKVQIPIGTDPRPTEGAGVPLSVLQGDPSPSKIWGRLR